MYMKVLVLHDKNEPGLDYVKIIKELKIDIIIFNVQKNWENSKDFINNVMRADFFLVFINKDILSSGWIKYISGYCAGNNKKICLYCENITIPQYLDHAVRIKDKKALQNYYSGEFDLWKRNSVINSAKKELERTGLSFGKFHYFYCIKENIYDSVDLFITAGMDPDTKDEKGVTGLCHAIRHSCNLIARLLIENGCNINIRSNDNNNNALMDAAAYNNEEMLKILLDKKSELNVQSKNEQTALMLAVGRGNEKNTKLLLEAGADIKIKDVLGMTAEDYAKILKNKKIIHLFENYYSGK